MKELEVLTLVDENDSFLGTDTWKECHEGEGKTHRAFVVFLFDEEGRLLLQRRSLKKKLWGGYWDVSYTSHVYPDEGYVDAAERRITEELGIDPVPVERVLDFTYKARFGDHSENEFCSLLVGSFSEPVKPNSREVDGHRVVAVEELGEEVEEKPEKFTPWFKIAFERFLEEREEITIP